MLPPADRSVAARDHAIPGLATVLDAAASAALVARLLPDAPTSTPVVTYTRYKPGMSCLVGLRYETAAGPVFATLKAVGTGAGEKWEKYRDDADAIVHDALRIAIRRFPVDGELDGPRWVLDPMRASKVRERLHLPAATQFDVIAYKPERRLVLAAMAGGEPVAVVKCYDATSFRHALASHQALALLPGMAVSPASAWYEKRGVLVAPWIPGRMLDAATDDVAHFADAGALLARLHDATMAVRDGDDDAAAGEAMQRIAESVTGWSPALREPLRRLVLRLSQHRAEPGHARVPIHGDFYTKQLLLGPSGVSLLDFDECAMDDPHIDLAIFAAHLERDVARRSYGRARAMAVLEGLLRGYRATRAVDERALAWRTAEALLKLAPHPFRHRDPDWPALTERLVMRAQALLDTIPSAVRRRTFARVARPTAAARRAWARLAADPAVAFAATLESPAVASSVLAHRRGAGDIAVTEVTCTRLVRHKVGRRALLAFDVRHAGVCETWLGKVRGRGLDTRGARVHQQLWDAGASGFIAEPLGVVDVMRMTLQRSVPGIPMLQTLADPRAAAAVAEGLAAALTALHQLRVPLERHWTPQDELSLLQTRLSALRDTATVRADLVAQLASTMARVAEPLHTRAGTATIHRDLYHDQVLVQGTRCLLVDLDLVAAGDPSLDVGNVVGHILELQWRGGIRPETAAAFNETFCRQMIARGGDALTEDSIARHTVLTLGRMLEIATRHPERVPFVPEHARRLSRLAARVDDAPELTMLFAERTWTAA
jgi:thiamine kinase-like enzyme